MMSANISIYKKYLPMFKSYIHGGCCESKRRMRMEHALKKFLNELRIDYRPVEIETGSFEFYKRKIKDIIKNDNTLNENQIKNLINQIK